MGKIGGSSWVNIVKKAFRSPTKKSSRRREEDAEEEEKAARGKRRWIFRKSCLQETTLIQHKHNEAESEDVTTTATTRTTTATGKKMAAEVKFQIRAAAVDHVRPSIFIRDYAAISIQTAFRGYLARKALQALKGVVKLQALVRGHNVRKRAKMTLQCMQSLIRVQDRVLRDHRKSLSYEEGTTTSSQLNNLCKSYLANTNSFSRDGSNMTDEWDTAEKEDNLARAFYHQMWRSGKDQIFLANQEEEATPIWYERAATVKQWERMCRNSFDNNSDHPIKTVEMDTATAQTNYTYSTTSKFQRSQYHYKNSNYISSPPRRIHTNIYIDSPRTPSLIKTKPQHSSASPRRDRNLITANYMAATASAKARCRSQSAPRHRQNSIITPDREKKILSKKRLSFPARDAISDVDSDHNLSSPSLHGVRFLVKQNLSYSACSKDSLGGDADDAYTRTTN